MRTGSPVSDWLNARTGYRALVAALSDRAPQHVHWAHALGVTLLVLLVTQLASGLTLMLYYVPTPGLAYDSVRYVIAEVPFGALIRGLHYYGASAIVALAVLHLLRTLWYGAYKAPREGTWLTGLVLLVILVAFGLTGYLLPWDQMGYWATVVRTNIAATTPIIGPLLSGLMKGGPTVGALTLSRWYALHVALLPLLLGAFSLVHLYLVRHHGRAGHYATLPTSGQARPRLLTQGLRNALVSTAAVAALLWWAARVRAPLESMADPTDLAFIPHPEWYFLWLFQLMKSESGPVEQLGAPIVLTIIAGFLALLPLLDRTPERHPRRRAWVVVVTGCLAAFVATLTSIALRDAPPDRDPNAWSPVAVAGMDVVERKSCLRCHGPEGLAPNVRRGHIAHDNAWIKNHLSDPETLVPGSRPIPFDAPTKADIVAVLAYVRMVRMGASPPEASKEERAVSLSYTTACASCHVMDGDGISDGPDLTHAGREHDAAWIAKKIVEPAADDPKARMPALADKMSPSEVHSMAEFLARRR